MCGSKRPGGNGAGVSSRPTQHESGIGAICCCAVAKVIE